MKADLTGYFNDCGICNQYMEKNKQQEKIPEKEVWYPFQKLSMDIAKTEIGKHILVIIDKYSGYNWTEKNTQIQ